MSVIHEYEGERWVFAKGAGGFVPITTHRYLDGELVEISEDDLNKHRFETRKWVLNQCVSLH